MKKLLIIQSVLALTVAATIIACSRTGDDSGASEHDLSGGVPIGQIRGVVAISDTIRTRLLDDSDPATGTFAVERLAGPAIVKLRTQLGVFAPQGTQAEYQGGTPTPLNMALWHQLFARFGDGIGGLCAGGGASANFSAYAVTDFDFVAVGFDAGPPGKAFTLFPSVAAQVTDACAFQGDEAARRKTASTLWDSVMGRGGSLAEEKEAFLVRFAAEGSPFVTAAPSDRVSSMFVAMMLNPHFLLAK